MTTQTKEESLQEIGRAAMNRVRRLVQDLRDANAAEDETAIDAARDAIQANQLSVEVRSPWCTSPQSDDYKKPAEYRMLLSTGGSATQIVGELDDYGQPDTADLQAQDWFQPWTDYRHEADGDYEVLLEYVREFYSGE